MKILIKKQIYQVENNTNDLLLRILSKYLFILKWLRNIQYIIILNVTLRFFSDKTLHTWDAVMIKHQGQQRPDPPPEQEEMWHRYHDSPGSSEVPRAALEPSWSSLLAGPDTTFGPPPPYLKQRTNMI